MKFLLIASFIAIQFLPGAYCQDKPKLNDPQSSSTTRKSAELPAAVNYDYAWDAFNHRGRLIWACRGVQSGDYVASELCAFKPKVDSQWPDKKLLGSWKE